MKMKKLVALLLTASMGLSLAACGSSDTTTESSAAESTTESSAADSSAASSEGGNVDPIQNLIDSTEGTVTLDLWCSELESYQTAMAELVDGFKATYPDVTFEITIGAVSEADTKDKVLEDPEAAADVFVFAGDQVADLVTAGALQPVATTYTYDPNETNSEGTVAAATVDGQLYAYPLTASNGYFLYYNSDVLTAENVASWESLTAAAEAAGKEVGMDMSSGWYLYGFFAGAGCEMVKQDDGSNSCDWNSETGVAVAESIMNITSSSAFVSYTDAEAQSKLPDGNLVAYVSGTWDAEVFETNYGTGYAATKLPTFDVNGTATQMGSFAGYKMVGVNAFSEYTGWAMLLAEYITSEESQTAIAAATGEGPANTVAASTISSPALSALAEQAAYADLEVVGGNYWDPAGSLGVSLAEGGVTDVQALLDEAVTGITQPAAAE